MSADAGLPSGGPEPHPVSAREARGVDVTELARMHVDAHTATAAAPKGAALAESRARGDAEQAAGRFASDLEGADRMVVLGCLGDVAVGYGVMAVADMGGPAAAGSPPRAVIEELWVDPEARSVGVGSAMLALLRAGARERGAGEVDAVALPGDRNTKNFFEDHGMVARAITVSGPAGP